ncbi:MAG TPA: GNAT family N-acetyltransferase [Chloroflexia bacterium]|nr:GNAT family N-acetyltransferase [Chloroflexia bacterium]
MVTTRVLQNEDIAALERLLMGAPQHNVFHLSTLAETGLGGPSWAVGVFLDGAMMGVVMATRGTGGVYYTSTGAGVLKALADVVRERSLNGRLALLSGHSSLLDPFLPLVRSSIGGRLDRCDFCVLTPGSLTGNSPNGGHNAQSTGSSRWQAPRIAGDADMERLIDFYLHGFYSLARLPSREAWRDRLSDQLAFRTLFLIEDSEGRVGSAALSSAEGGGAAMLGGVATLDEYRDMGLSTHCVAALCGDLFAEGAQSIGLFYLKDNVPAARVYARLGFKPAGEWLLVPMGLGIVFG